MTKIVPLLLTLIAATPALSEAVTDKPAPYRFEANGITYICTDEMVRGVRHIHGEEVETGKRFDLRSAHGRVWGDYNGSSLSFAMPAGAKSPNLQTANR